MRTFQGVKFQMLNKRVLITGATGFLGSHLAKALLEHGCEVVALKRTSSGLHRIAAILPKLTLFDIDAIDLPTLFLTGGKIDAVIHTATCYGRNGEAISQIFEANTAFPLRLLQAASNAGVSVFINTDTVLDKYLNAYALSKKHFLDWAMYFAQQTQIRLQNVRLEHFYGPGDDNWKFTTHVINSCMANLPELKLTSGEQKRDFIYIDDVVSAYLILLERTDWSSDLFMEFDVGTGNPISIREFVETVHRMTRSKTKLEFGALPYRKGEVMCSQSNIEPLTKLGWSCKTSLERGLKVAMEGYKKGI